MVIQHFLSPDGLFGLQECWWWSSESFHLAYHPVWIILGLWKTLCTLDGLFLCQPVANHDLFSPSTHPDHMTGTPGAKVRPHILYLCVCVCVCVCVRPEAPQHLQLKLYLSQAHISAERPCSLWIWTILWCEKAFARRITVTSCPTLCAVWMCLSSYSFTYFQQYFAAVSW